MQSCSKSKFIPTGNFNPKRLKWEIETNTQEKKKNEKKKFLSGRKIDFHLNERKFSFLSEFLIASIEATKKKREGKEKSDDS